MDVVIFMRNVVSPLYSRLRTIVKRDFVVRNFARFSRFTTHPFMGVARGCNREKMINSVLSREHRQSINETSRLTYLHYNTPEKIASSKSLHSLNKFRTVMHFANWCLHEQGLSRSTDVSGRTTYATLTMAWIWGTILRLIFKRITISRKRNCGMSKMISC